MAEERSINDAVTVRGDSGSALGSIDKYLLKSELGEGGFGAVYLAEDTVASRKLNNAVTGKTIEPVYCAVKGLPPEVRSNANELENVRENFALVRKLHHPHIAAALDLHLAEKVMYFKEATQRKLRIAPGDTLLVMEYASGVTLDKWRKQFSGKRVPFDHAVEVVRQIAEALDYAHNERIIHRDIKPSNIMVETRLDGSANVKVLDFGLAAEIRSSLGRVSLEVRDKSGTRPYMAPEQWLGQRQGAATDQYALAVLLYELLVGEVPFASVFETDDPAIMQTVVTTVRPEIPKELPKPVRRALIRALAKTPKDRFASCADFVAALNGRSGVAGSWIFLIGVVALAIGGWWWMSLRNGKERTDKEVLPIVKTDHSPMPPSSPKPKPTPVPTPSPDPQPTPVPSPEPIPVQTPEPAPTPVPAPKPAPVPAPAPKPIPAPAPKPTPAPQPAPKSRPTPVQTAIPSPQPVPVSQSSASSMPKIESVSVKRLTQLDTRMFKGGEWRRVEIASDIMVDMVWCPAGEFVMGSPVSDRDRRSNESQHRITIDQGFWIGRYEVSQGLWTAVMGSNPSKSKHFQHAADYPVDSVSHDTCLSFLNRLNAKAGTNGFRLPTEAEWEYACRAGTTTAYCFGDRATSADMQVRGSRQSGGPVKSGTYRSNAWGIYDMHGNLAEWCDDLYVADYGSEPGWRNHGYVLRGGSWHDRPSGARSAARDNQKGQKPSPMYGMRLCFSAKRNAQQKADWGEAENTRLALEAFNAGNWSLGFTLAERADQTNPNVLRWLGKCYDPLVSTPGFRIDKDFFRSRDYYNRAEEFSNQKKGNDSK